jgi:hypothetical protein
MVIEISWQGFRLAVMKPPMILLAAFYISRQ